MPFVSHDATRPSPRWTPSRIAKALAFPKPKGAIVKAMAYESGRLLRPKLPTGEEVQILRYIVEHADMLDVPAPLDDSVLPYNRAAGWLLVPVPQWVIDGLAQLDAGASDLEPDVDREPGEADELGGDDEPSHVRPTSVSRVGLDDGTVSLATAARCEAAGSGDLMVGVNRWRLQARDYRRI